MDKDQHYKMATKAALASGEEGYTALSQGHLEHYVWIATTRCILQNTVCPLLLSVFMFIIYRGGSDWRPVRAEPHRGHAQPLQGSRPQEAEGWRGDRGRGRGVGTPAVSRHQVSTIIIIIIIIITIIIMIFIIAGPATTRTGRSARGSTPRPSWGPRQTAGYSNKHQRWVESRHWWSAAHSC